MAELFSQTRYSWPPSTAATQRAQSPIPLRKGSKHKRGPRMLTQTTMHRYRKYSSSCGDLRTEGCNQPHLTADQGAQGDGMHNQNTPRPKKVTFRKDAEHLFADPSQAQKGRSHTENEDDNKNVEHYLQMSSMPVDGDCSDQYLTNVNAFLKRVVSEDGSELNSKHGDNLILDAIRAGMLLELKRKDTSGSNETELESAGSCSVAHETEKKDIETGGGNAGLLGGPQRERIDSTLGGDKQSEHGGNVKRRERRNREEENGNMCHVTKCTNTVDSCKGCDCKEYGGRQNNDISEGNDGSNSDSSCCEVEYIDEADTYVKKPAYPRREEADCVELLAKDTEMECEVYEINDTAPVGNKQTSGKGHAQQQRKGNKRVLAGDFATYRIELGGDDLDGKIVGKMFVPLEGDDKFRDGVHVVIQNGDKTDAEDVDVNHFQCPPLGTTDIVGKVFTMKIASLVSSHEEQGKTTKPSPVKGADDAADNPSSCSLCLVEFTSEHQARSHYNGKAHNKRTFVSSRVNKFHCDACSITYTSRKHEEQHVRGRKHRSRVDALAAETPAPDAVSLRSPVKGQAEPPTTGLLVCGLCSITTNSRDNLVDHFKSYKHLKKMETLKKTSHVKENPAESSGLVTSQSKPSQSPNKAATSPVRAAVTTPDVSAVSNAQAQRTYPQPCQPKQAAYGPVPITFQVPKSKFNLSNLKKMVRTVGTQFTNTNRDELGGEGVTRPDKPLPPRRKMAEPHRCQGAAADYIECGAPSGAALNVFGGGRSWRPGGCKAGGGCRSWKKRTGTI